jgi:outer membrane protein assembly factor BamB
MILSNGLLFMVSDAGIATCADSKTGEAVWSERIPGNYSASPVLAEGRIYFLNEAGLTTVVRADRVFEVLSSNDLAEKSLASPTPDDGSMYVRTETKLHRIGR